MTKVIDRNNKWKKGGEKTMTRLSLSRKHPGKLTKISRDLTEIGHSYEFSRLTRTRLMSLITGYIRFESRFV